MTGQRRLLRVSIGAAVVALGVSGGTASGQPHEIDKLLASDGAADDWFGESVSLSGNTAVVGTYQDDDNGNDSGSAYVFVRDGGGWTQQAKLLPTDGAEGDSFGSSVALSGDTAVVGAHRGNDNGDDSGSAYVFVREGSVWTQQAKLLPSDGAAGDWFGVSVSLLGDTAVVGAFWDDDNEPFSGSAYVFVRDGDEWVQQAKLLPSDGAEGDAFGNSVSLSGDTVVVGAYWDEDNGYNSGSAYVFVRNGGEWAEQAKLLPSDGPMLDRFGSSVSLSGDTAVVGRHGDDDDGPHSGSAYVFVHDGNGWVQQAKLVPSDGAPFASLGDSVGFQGHTVLVGADGDEDNGDSSGSAYVFVREGVDWVEHAKVMASDGAWYDYFGWSVSLSGDTALVGAYGNNDHGSDSGSAYVFDVRSCASDIDGSSEVGFADLIALLAAWGPCEGCPSDIDLDGVVGLGDLLMLLASWGSCPQPGACCLPDGTCEQSSLGGHTCAARGGVYHGDSTVCADFECLQPGACCLADGSCEQSDVGGGVCEAQGGVYIGDGTVCADVECAHPGACCLPDASCVQVASVGGAECASVGGTYQGDDTSCATAPCGACCLTDQTCDLRFEEVCLAAGGSFIGVGTICNVDCTNGACCLPDGSCFFVEPAVCDVLAGDYQGNGVLCDLVTCP